MLAAAGLNRLGLTDRITCLLDADEMLPAVGQGVIGCEIRVDDDHIFEYLQPLNHRATHHAPDHRPPAFSRQHMQLAQGGGQRSHRGASGNAGAAETELAKGELDLIAFGTNFISNPDLVERMKNGWPLAKPEPSPAFVRPGRLV